MNAQVAQRIGQGLKKVMVIHGWFGPSVYDGFFQDFDLNAYEFAIVHNPGYGVAKGSAPSADMTALANSLFELADQLGWEKFQVIGHSYGGAAGLRMASLHPERITSLAGIAPVMPSGFDATAATNCGANESTGPAFMAAFAKGKDASDGPRMIAAALDPVLARDAHAMDALMANLYSCINEGTYKQYFLVWTGCSFVNEVKGLGTRTLFLLGQSDPFAALNYVTPTVQSMQPGKVEVKQIPGGHFLTVSGKQKAAEALKSFLS